MSEQSPSRAPIAATGEQDDRDVVLRLLALVAAIHSLLILAGVVDDLIQSMSFNAWFVYTPQRVSRIDNAIVSGKRVGSWFAENPLYLPALVQALASLVIAILGVMFAAGADFKPIRWLLLGGRR